MFLVIISYSPLTLGKLILIDNMFPLSVYTRLVVKRVHSEKPRQRSLINGFNLAVSTHLAFVRKVTHTYPYHQYHPYMVYFTYI